MQKDCSSNPCQRFRSALNLEVHLHVLALDGAYTFAGECPRSHRARAPTAAELEGLLDALIRRSPRTLVTSSGRAANSRRNGHGNHCTRC